MYGSIDKITHRISECAEAIEDYKRSILRLRREIRNLSAMAVEADDGEISYVSDL